MPRRTSREDPNQLKMFMTKAEIMHNYEPLEGDLEETGDYERTGRALRSTRVNGKALRNIHDPDRKLMGFVGGKGDYVRQSRTETHEEFWGRKQEEAQMDPIDYAESRQQVGSHNTGRPFDISAAMNRSSAPKPPKTGPNGGITTSRLDSFEWHEHSYLERKVDDWRMENENRPSIFESVRAEGVKKPVHLSYQFEGPGGKQQIVGGHHRIASARDTDYIPVEHHADIWEAQQAQGYT